MTYIRKTRDEFQVHQMRAGQWEEVHCEETWRAARERLKEYRTNQPEAPVKIIKRRVAK